MTPYCGVAHPQTRPIVCPPTSIKRFSGIAMRGITKDKTTKLFSRNSTTPKPYLPPDLGKSAERLAVRSNDVGFLKGCVEARGPHELNQLPPNPHPTTTLIAHMREHGVPMSAKRGMTKQELTRGICYSTHSSAAKETAFFRTEWAEQARAGRISLFLLRAILYLPQLWLSLLTAILQ